MKLTTTTNISVDGVMQGLGGPDEDHRGDSSAADGSARANEPSKTCARQSSERRPLPALLTGLAQLLVELRVAELDRVRRRDTPDPLECLGA